MCGFFLRFDWMSANVFLIMELAADFQLKGRS